MFADLLPAQRRLRRHVRLSSFSLLNGPGKPMRADVVILKSRLVASGDVTTEEQS